MAEHFEKTILRNMHMQTRFELIEIKVSKLVTTNNNINNKP